MTQLNKEFTMNKKSIKLDITIDKNKSEMWNILFNPLIESSSDLRGLTGELGSERKCEIDTSGRNYLHEKITDVRGTDSFDVDIIEGGGSP